VCHHRKVVEADYYHFFTPICLFTLQRRQSSVKNGSTKLGLYSLISQQKLMDKLGEVGGNENLVLHNKMKANWLDNVCWPNRAI
jgi:hypothetical protein